MFVNKITFTDLFDFLKVEDMKNSLICLLVLFSLIHVSCMEPKEMVSYDVNLDKTSGKGAFFSGYHYVRLDNDKDCLLSGIEKVLVTDTYISILDKDRILFFQPDGRFSSKIERRGRGTGEYRKIDDYAIQGNLVYILSRLEKKIKFYTFDGNYVGKMDLNDWYMHMTFYKKDTLVLSSENSNNTQKNFLMIDMKTPKEVGQYDSFSKNESMTFPSCPVFCGSDDEGLFVIHPFDYTIYRLNETGISPYRSFNFPNHNISEDMQAMSYYDAYMKTKNAPVVKYLGLYKETSNYTYATLQMFDVNSGLCPYIYQIDAKGKSSVMKLGWDFSKNAPYVSKPLAIYKDFVVSALPAKQVLSREEYYKKETFKKKGLTPKDNYVLFFNKLVQ